MIHSRHWQFPSTARQSLIHMTPKQSWKLRASSVESQVQNAAFARNPHPFHRTSSINNTRSSNSHTILILTHSPSDNRLPPSLTAKERIQRKMPPLTHAILTRSNNNPTFMELISMIPHLVWVSLKYLVFTGLFLISLLGTIAVDLCVSNGSCEGMLGAGMLRCNRRGRSP